MRRFSRRSPKPCNGCKATKTKSSDRKRESRKEAPMDPASLAATAMTVVSPYLAEFGADAAKEVASSAGKSVWDWITGKLTSPAGQEVVADWGAGDKPPATFTNRVFRALPVIASVAKQSISPRVGRPTNPQNRSCDPQ